MGRVGALILSCCGNILLLRSEAGRTMSGRTAHFFVGPVGVHWYRHWPGSLRVNLEKVREAAERVARSEGLEVVDVEWKVGRDRFLRVTIDRVPTANRRRPAARVTASKTARADTPAGGMAGLGTWIARR